MKGMKTGGRKKGTPNKVTSLARGMIQKWLDAHGSVADGDTVPLIMHDFESLEPRDRVKVTCDFIKIIMPRNISIDDSSEQVTIEETLRELANDNG